MKRLSILRCPQHGYYAVSIDEEGGGTRITPIKCCGSWREIKSWPLSSAQWKHIEHLAGVAATEPADTAAPASETDDGG